MSTPAPKNGRKQDPTERAEPKAQRTERLHPLAQLQQRVGNRVVSDIVRNRAIQLLKEGDGPSHDVGVIQQQLNATGLAARLAITGRFDSPTTTAAKAFQRKLITEKVAGVTEDGIVEGVTHQKLKDSAPSISISGADTVVTGPGNTQVLDNPAAGTHSVLKIGAKGNAVKELQERLNNSPTMADAARLARATAKDKLVVDGRFGPRTSTALKVFQADAKVAATGVADVGTWAKLETAGAASQGHVEFEWREEVEGVTNVGGRANYDWRLSKSALTISVGIRFIPKSKNVDGRIAQWLGDIHDIWSTFKAVNQADKTKTIDIDFEAKRGGSAATVTVRNFDPSLKKADRASSRSDAANWYTIDTRRGLAPHEYGHLLGLADEYNRDEGQYRAVTGEEPSVGNPVGDPAKAKTLATAIKAELPLTDVLKKPGPAALDDKRWGAKLAGVVNPVLGDAQGGFSRLVSQEYQKANGTALPADIMAAFNAVGVTGFQNNKSSAITPFLYSNRSLMGTMETVPAAGTGGAAAAAHEHPIEARHVNPFINILAKEWALQTGKADTWKPERR